MSTLRWSVRVGGKEVARFRWRGPGRSHASHWAVLQRRRPKRHQLSVELACLDAGGRGFIYLGRALRPGETP